jgi:hypothetical protein
MYWKPLVVLLLAGALAGCQTVQTTQSGAVGVDRTQTMMLSAGEVNRAAEQAYQQTLQQAARKGALNRNAGPLPAV